ncbi:MAG: FkbM family methyltransferase [Holosporaceae bacterium]|jgi:FkbM family methyltransferase|nr:FkbM family methyltransferase [Holosporaceae bacterium]
MRKFLSRIFLLFSVSLLLQSPSRCRAEAPGEASVYGELKPLAGWSRYSGDSARSVKGWWRWWWYLLLKEATVITWMDGLKLKVYPRNEIYRSISVRGIYNPNFIVAIKTLLAQKEGGVFIDVGADMGHFSLLSASAVGSRGRIHAIEPSSRDFGRLKENVSINDLQSVIRIHRLAISDRSGPTKLSVACEERSALNTLGDEFSFKGVEKVTVEDVEAVTIDEFVEKEGVDRLDVLKLDVEGSETRALTGALKTLERFRPAIMLGVNAVALKSCGSSLEELLSLVRRLKYRIYMLAESPTFGLEEISDVAGAHVKVVFCLHEGATPPTLPQPENLSVGEILRDFFLR